MEMPEEDADVEYYVWNFIGAEDMWEHEHEDRMSIILEYGNIVVDIDIEDDDEIEESRTSKTAMKEKERLKKFQLMITFESQEKDDDDSLPPMALINLLSTAELVEFGRDDMGHSYD